MNVYNVIFLFFVVNFCDGQYPLNRNGEKSENINQRTVENVQKNAQNIMSESNPSLNHESILESCSNDDVACLTMASHDRLGLEAIKTLHRQLDDDANGAVDLSESDDFLREELKYDSGYERRQKAFHYNDDMHISVRELWEAWQRSEVHNWTVEQTSEWLAGSVELPQYVPTFIQHRVTGATLPRLAVNNMNYLNNILGIKDPIHKQKISLKAMDVVLFGPPKEGQHLWKDWMLMVLLCTAMFGCWYTYRQHKNSRNHLARMMRDMDSLHRAEIALEDLQKELERARLEQENVTTEKQNLEKKLQEAGGDSGNFHTSYSDLEVSQLKAEIEMLRGELQRAEGELEDRCWSPPLGLQHWLQLTHELENKSYQKKKLSAEAQLQLAREACEKLRKKRSSLVGAFVSTHGKSIDDVDRSIVEARTSLNEVTHELQERVHRWKQIELLCGFNIVNNSGLPYLESILYRNNMNGRPAGLRGRVGNNQDDLDDDTISLNSPGGYHTSGGAWRDPADSSGSENGKPDDEFGSDPRLAGNNVHFIVGGETTNWAGDEVQPKTQRPQSLPCQAAQPQPPPRRTNSNNNIPPAPGNMVRSQSQDIKAALSENAPSVGLLPKTFNSETSLNAPQPAPIRSSSGVRQRIIKEQQPVSASGDEEVYSTDSSTVDDEAKRRKRKLFPGFSKKNKGKE